MSWDDNPFKTQKDFDEYVYKLVDRGIIKPDSIDIDLLMEFLQDTREYYTFRYFMPLLSKNGINLFDYVSTEIPVDFADRTSYPKNLRKIVLPEGVKIIREGAFRYCQYRQVIFPSSLEIIEDGAFDGCNNLSKVDLSNTNCQIIHENAFSFCNVKVVLFSNTLKRIQRSAFYGYFDTGFLNKLEFPASLEDIGDNCFHSSFGGKSLEFNEGLKSIGSNAFNRSYNLSEVTLCTTLDNDTLDRIWDCRASYYIFKHCDNLKTIYCKSESQYNYLKSHQVPRQKYERISVPDIVLLK